MPDMPVDTDTLQQGAAWRQLDSYTAGLPAEKRRALSCWTANVEQPC
jgi:hypothetical protein